MAAGWGWEYRAVESRDTDREKEEKTGKAMKGTVRVMAGLSFIHSQHLAMPTLEAPLPWPSATWETQGGFTVSTQLFGGGVHAHTHTCTCLHIHTWAHEAYVHTDMHVCTHIHVRIDLAETLTATAPKGSSKCVK